MVRVDGVGGRNALGKITVHCLALSKTLIKSVRDHCGTLFLARPATGAFVFLNVTGLSADRDLEISDFAVNLFYFTVGQEFDIGMSTDIQHLRREYSDGTIVCGECLVQMGHLAANAWQAFNQVYLDAHIREV